MNTIWNSVQIVFIYENSIQIVFIMNTILKYYSFMKIVFIYENSIQIVFIMKIFKILFIMNTIFINEYYFNTIFKNE